MKILDSTRNRYRLTIYHTGSSVRLYLITRFGPIYTYFTKGEFLGICGASKAALTGRKFSYPTITNVFNTAKGPKNYSITYHFGDVLKVEAIDSNGEAKSVQAPTLSICEDLLEARYNLQWVEYATRFVAPKDSEDIHDLVESGDSDAWRLIKQLPVSPAVAKQNQAQANDRARRKSQSADPGTTREAKLSERGNHERPSERGSANGTTTQKTPEPSNTTTKPSGPSRDELARKIIQDAEAARREAASLLEMQVPPVQSTSKDTQRGKLPEQGNPPERTSEQSAPDGPPPYDDSDIPAENGDQDIEFEFDDFEVSQKEIALTAQPKKTEELGTVEGTTAQLSPQGTDETKQTKFALEDALELESTPVTVPPLVETPAEAEALDDIRRSVEDFKSHTHAQQLTAFGHIMSFFKSVQATQGVSREVTEEKLSKLLGGREYKDLTPSELVGLYKTIVTILRTN